ncbi:peptidoglycan endopeptidase [Lactobacillus sp. S2-2]|nr:NlpC/P60 family protein [Lactobacillus sp. S2-2]MCF6515287.1 peptidoglycan endopeptidase [Lactobacillus sp. S2-2]
MVILSTNVSASEYYKENPQIVKIKKTVAKYKDETKKVHKGYYRKNNFVKVSSVQGHTLKTASGYYISANKNFVKKTQGYQNPKRYHQVNYTQIKPYGKVGHSIGVGYEGIKTYKVMKRLGTYNGYNKYNYATKYAVQNFQRKHHIKATGRVNEKTWVKLGLKKSQWKSIDSYVAPLGAKAWQGRKAHVDAAIKQAKRYLGNLYLVGSSSYPFYGTDCSGLVMQALYAGGINPKPVSSIHHGYPGNEWNSRNLFKDNKFKRVSYSHRQRGDLIFYYQPGTRTVWHVALYLGHNQVIESWPPRVMIQPIKNSQRSIIAGVSRPWN